MELGLFSYRTIVYTAAVFFKIQFLGSRQQALHYMLQFKKNNYKRKSNRYQTLHSVHHASCISQPEKVSVYGIGRDRIPIIVLYHICSNYS